MGLKLKYLSSLALCITLSAPIIFAQTQSNSWHEAKNINGNYKAVSALPDIEVFSAPNVIMIKVNQSTDVRLFTILGKIISSQHLEPGIFEYHLESHGIYIVKTDISSCKIAI